MVRTRVVAALAAVLLPATILGVFPAAAGPSDKTILAQAPGNSGGDDAAKEGQKGAKAQVGAGEGESGSGAAEEGPPWTYQMARMALGMLVLLLLAVGMWYYRFVIARQRTSA